MSCTYNPNCDMERWETAYSVALANADNYYTKSEVDEMIASGGGGCDLSDYWTSGETETAIAEAVSGKANTSDVESALAEKLDISAYTPTDLTEYWTSAQTTAAIASATSGKTDNSAFTAHTSDTDIHVTASDKTNWNGKLDATAYTPTNLSEYWTSAQTTAAIASATSGKADTSAVTATYATKAEVIANEEVTATALNGLENRKADKDGIKTINGQSLIGSGDLIIGTGGTIVIDYQLDDTSDNAVANSAITVAIQSKADQSTTYTKSEVDALIQGGGGGLDLPIWLGEKDTAIIANYSGNTASAHYSFAQGMGPNIASGYSSHAEGYHTIAGGYGAHSEGHNTQALGAEAHSEGEGTRAVGMESHTEGYETSAFTEFAHAEGEKTMASGYASHAEGYYSETYGGHSHASGRSVKTINDYEQAIGMWNLPMKDYENPINWGAFTLFTVGDGSADNNRHNALDIRRNGDIWFKLDNQQGDVKLQTILLDILSRLTALES